MTENKTNHQYGSEFPYPATGDTLIAIKEDIPRYPATIEGTLKEIKKLCLFIPEHPAHLSDEFLKKPQESLPEQFRILDRELYRISPSGSDIATYGSIITKTGNLKKDLLAAITNGNTNITNIVEDLERAVFSYVQNPSAYSKIITPGNEDTTMVKSLEPSPEKSWETLFRNIKFKTGKGMSLTEENAYSVRQSFSRYVSDMLKEEKGREGKLKEVKDMLYKIHEEKAKMMNGGLSYVRYIKFLTITHNFLAETLGTYQKIDIETLLKIHEDMFQTLHRLAEILGIPFILPRNGKNFSSTINQLSDELKNHCIEPVIGSEICKAIGYIQEQCTPGSLTVQGCVLDQTSTRNLYERKMKSRKGLRLLKEASGEDSIREAVYALNRLKDILRTE